MPNSGRILPLWPDIQLKSACRCKARMSVIAVGVTK